MTKGLRRALVIAAIVLGVCVVLRLVLDPLAAYETRKALRDMKGFAGDLDGVHVSLLPPFCEITNLAVWKSPGGHRKEPLFFAERTRAGLSWRNLLHGRLVAGLRLQHPKMSIIRGPSPEEPPPKAPPAPDVSGELARILPFRLARLEILDGEVLFRDDAAPLHPEVWVHDLELAGENVPTRRPLASGRPATVTARGTLGKSGALSLFVTADPFARPLAFAGRLSVRHFRAAELYAFLEPKVHLQAPEGTIDVFGEFESRGGQLTSGVKGLLKDVEVRPTSDDLWDRLRAWLGDKAFEIASDRVPERRAVATTIPIEGPVTHPDVQVWPAVLGVVRNSFVAGLKSGFTGLPPAKAAAPEPPLEQARKALSKKPGPPRAQPTQPKQEKK